MAVADDLQKIAEQERALIFPSFDEATALALGLAIKTAAEARKMHLAIDVRLWDRQLFFFSMPGAVADNSEWARRKCNCVRRFGRPSMAIGLRQQERGRGFAVDDGVDQTEIAAHGGAFPIRVAGAGVIGAIAVSGAPSRDDHGLVVAAIAALLGLDGAALALTAE